MPNHLDDRSRAGQASVENIFPAKKSLAQLDAQFLAAHLPHFELLDFARLRHRKLAHEHYDLRHFEVGHLRDGAEKENEREREVRLCFQTT